MFIFNSSIGKKFVQAISGAFLILFLLLHATINFFSVIDSFTGKFGAVAIDDKLFSAGDGLFKLGCDFMSTPVISIMVPVLAVIGSGLLEGYLRILIIYCVLAAILLFIVFPLIVRLARGRENVKSFFTHIIPPTVTSLATASSSVAMPGNIEAAENMGIDRSVAQSVVPLATNLLKGGSVALDVIKVVFLMTLCGQATNGLLPAAGIIGIAILSALVSGAVTNGGVTGELLICTLLGVRPEMAGIIMIIGTIADIPATLVNSQSTVIAAAIVDKRKTQDNA